MGDFRYISKTIIKVFKHLLNVVSTDTSRTALCRIHVKDGMACAADGFMLTFLQLTGTNNYPLDLEDGDYTVRLGSINHNRIAELVKFETDKYPNLFSVLHKPDTKPITTVAINAHMLCNAIKEADGMVVFHIFSPVEPVEMQYTVGLQSVYSCIMPMHPAGEHSVPLWKPTPPVPPVVPA